MREKGVGAYDAKGQEISAVREAEAADGGINVKVLMPVRRFCHVTGTQLFGLDADREPVELSAFVKGGYIK